MNRPTRGVTLLEMIVALTILAVGVGVASISLHVTQSPAHDQVRTSIDSARVRAITMAQPISMLLKHGEQTVALTITPDGRVNADPSVEVDYLTGMAK